MSEENDRIRFREIAEHLLQKLECESEGFWEELRDDIAKALDEAEARGRPQWRPASEPPTKVGPYLVTDGRNVRHGWWSQSEGRWTPMTTVITPTHWMPLPPPPTEEQKR